MQSPAGQWMQNGFVESFNGRMRDELLNETMFRNLSHARIVIRDGAHDYNTNRPHSALGYLTATLSAIVNGHKKSQEDELLPWNYVENV